MSGGDDFRTQYKDWGWGEDDRPVPKPEPPEVLVLTLVRQYGPKKVKKWLASAEQQYEKDKKDLKRLQREAEIKRLQVMVEEGERAKSRLLSMTDDD